MEQLFHKCPVCGSNEVVIKSVETIIKGGHHTAEVRVDAEVCEKCGERLYSPESLQLFEKVRQELESGKVKNLKPIGTAFELV
jgi:YgiT-type zinc finger domain-containing protein